MSTPSPSPSPRPVRLSAGIIPVVAAAPGGGNNRVLVLRAYRHWDFPKGMVEAGESPLQAALRELSEETGMGGTDLVWGEGFYETERYGPGKVARYYLGAVEERPLELPVSQELGRPEHDEYRWLSVAAAQRLLVPRVAAALEWATAKILAASSDGHGAPTSAT